MVKFRPWQLAAVLVAAVLVALTAVTYAAPPQAAGGGSDTGQESQQWCLQRRVPPLLKDLHVQQLHECRSVPPVLLVPYLWTPVQLKIQCPTSWYSVYTAPDEELLAAKLELGEVAWCGLESVVDGKTCSLQLSPFARTFIGIKRGNGCKVTSNAAISPLMVVSGAVGLLLFFAAPLLSSSFAFRLSCGTLLFTTGSLLIAMVFLLRMLPHKRTVATAMAAAGSGGLALVRWLTGQWFPSWQQLVTNRFFGLYVIVSAVLGVVVTYLYDDMQNRKVDVVIKATLRVVGLLLVYFATWTLWPVSATALGILIATLVGPGVAKGAAQASAAVQQVAATTHKYLVTPFSVRRWQPRTAVPPSALRTPVSTRPPHPVQQLRRDDVGPHADGWDSPRSALPAGPSPLALAEVDRLLPSEYHHLTPIHLKTTPPAPWEVRPKRTVAVFEEAVLRATKRAAKRTSKRAGATQGSAGPSNQGLQGYDFEDEAQGGTGTGSQGPEDELHLSVKKGFITNPRSGRLIKVGGDTYTGLIAEGYYPDTGRGILVAPGEGVPVPPPSTRSAGPKSAPRSSPRFGGVL